MPKTKTLTREEAHTLLYPFCPITIQRIFEKAFTQGKRVELVQSSFSDPGEDYNAFLIDGAEVYREDGY